MINVYYKHSIEKFVLPTIYSTNKQQRLQLTGPISAVNEMKQRYELMSEIIKQKSRLSIQTDEQTNYDQYKQLRLDNVSDRSNIVMLCSPEDETFLNCLASHLTDEGYLVCINSFNQLWSSTGSQFEKTDLIIVYFTPNYLENEDCIAQIKLAKISKKKIITILSTGNLIEQENNWLHSITILDLYYELFQEENYFKLDEDFGVEYDKLLVELVGFN